MNPAKVLVVTVLAGVLSIGIALFGEHWLDTREGGPGGPRRGDGGPLATLPDIRLSDLNGREVASNGWAGKVVVINYWATWCPPCLREMPMLVELQRAFDNGQLQVVGIAIDRREDVERFVAERPLNYPILLGGIDAVETARALGNRTDGLPFTVIFDAYGRRVFSQTGEISADVLRAELEALLTPPAKSQTG